MVVCVCVGVPLCAIEHREAVKKSHQIKGDMVEFSYISPPSKAGSPLGKRERGKD